MKNRSRPVASTGFFDAQNLFEHRLEKVPERIEHLSGRLIVSVQ